MKNLLIAIISFILCFSLSLSPTLAQGNSPDIRWAVTSADDCAGISENETLYPVTDPTFSTIEYMCASGTLEGATPDTIQNAIGCDFTQSATVWFKVVTDDIAAQLFTTVTTQGNWQPMWSVYYGNDCDTLTNAASGSAPPCSKDDDSPDLHQTAVEDGYNTYYVAVSADPNDAPVDDPQFEICAATIINVVVCLGELGDNCEPDPSTKIKIVDRQFNDLEPGMDPETGYLGPFCPGEEVQVHIEFFYDASETGADWFMGFIPDFGKGWEMEDYDFSFQPPIASGGNGGPGVWHEWDGPCNATMQEPVPHLCTYLDDDGVLRLCNALCESCSDCDELGLEEGDMMPSGYFWTTDGSNAGCMAGSCKPGEQWGIGSVTTQLTWDFTLKVKSFNTLEECLENNDLQITFQSFSDGGLGCWEDPVGECLIDRKQLGPNWQVDCGLNTIDVVSTPSMKEICSGEFTGIDVATADGSLFDIAVSYEDNPFIEGENNYVFADGIGTIDDELVLADNICVPQMVRYFARALTDQSVCSEFVDTITVWVFPPPAILESTIMVDCYPGELTIDLSALLVCEGYPGPLEWEWRESVTGQEGDSSIITIDNSFLPGSYTYDIGITDELGCSIENILQVTIPEALQTEVTTTPETVDGFMDGTATVEPEGGTEPYTFVWNNEATTQSITELSGGTYIVSVTDANGCIAIDTAFVDVEECYELEIQSQQINESCLGACDGVISLTGVTNGTPPFQYEWSNGSDQALINELCSGEYLVTITDANDCIVFDTLFISRGYEVIIEVDSIIDISETTLGAILVNTNNNGSYTFYWTGPEDFTSSDQLLLNLQVPGCYTLEVTDMESGCMNEVTVCLEDLTATIDPSLAEIRLYPNPVSDQLIIDFSALEQLPSHIGIYNSYGKVMTELIPRKEQHSFETESFPSGVYFVRISGEEGSLLRRVVVE